MSIKDKYNLYKYKLPKISYCNPKEILTPYIRVESSFCARMAQSIALTAYVFSAAMLYISGTTLAILIRLGVYMPPQHVYRYEWCREQCYNK